MGGIVVQADKGLIVLNLKPWIYKLLGGLRHLRAFSAVAIPGNRLAVFVLEPRAEAIAHPLAPAFHLVERFEAIAAAAAVAGEGIQEPGSGAARL